MYLISGTYDIYGLKSKTHGDITFQYKDQIDIQIIDDTEDSAMEVIKTKLIEEFGEFNIDRLDIESSRPIIKEFYIGWNSIDF